MRQLEEILLPFSCITEPNVITFLLLELAQAHHKDGLLKCFAYRGLANCLYHLEEYEYALRCFLKIEALKSSNWNENSIENAMVENNIGCCYMIMNRNNEASKHFEVAHSILDL